MSLQLETVPASIGLPCRRDRDYQAGILPGVSRTFALTIPVLPDKLADVVTNACLFALSSNRRLRSLFRFAAAGLPLWQADTATWMSMVGPGRRLGATRGRPHAPSRLQKAGQSVEPRSRRIAR